jgi:hypothetical protein
LCPRTQIAKIAQELVFVWEATEAEKWIDKLEWIPFEDKNDS